MWRTPFRKLKSFTRLPLFTQMWLTPIWLILGISKALIFTISFKRLAGHLGSVTDVLPWIPLIDTSQQAQALKICRTIRLAARYTPWDSNCFPQAVAARLLLGLYGIPYALFFGLMRDTQTLEMKAHAWVSAGRVTLTGGASSFENYVVVGMFLAPALCPT